MTNILTDISTYDTKKHTAYPTLEYVLETTGEDLIANQGDVLKGKAFLKQITETAFNILKQSKIKDTANRLEYLIATNEAYRQAFLDYVCSFIYDLYYGGVDVLLSPTDKLKLTNTLSPKTKSYVEGSLLGIDRFVWFHYDYHVGY